MRPNADVHDALARLVEYPRDGWFESMREASLVIGASCPEAAELLTPFLTFAADRPLWELEEHFTRTFDNSDERALDMGWHAFGETYTRGSFMAAMRGRLRETGVEENGELPDHLSHMLALVGRCPEDEAAGLAGDIMAPSVAKVREALVKRSDPWAHVLATVLAVLALHEPDTAPHQPASANARDTGEDDAHA